MESSDDVGMSPGRFRKNLPCSKPAALGSCLARLPSASKSPPFRRSECTAQATQDDYAQHRIFYALRRLPGRTASFTRYLAPPSILMVVVFNLIAALFIFAVIRRPPRPLTSYGERYRPEDLPLGICERNTRQGLRSIIRNRPPLA